MTVAQLWTCPECSFSFDAQHENTETKDMTCPLCELDAIQVEFRRASRLIEMLATTVAEQEALLKMADEAVKAAWPDVYAPVGDVTYTQKWDRLRASRDAYVQGRIRQIRDKR